MVNVQRSNLLDAKSPNPSVETLLHAFLPHKFIDHTHSNAVLALTDQPDGEALAADLYGKRAALVPYVMPGFALAKKCSEVGQANPDVEGLILLKHGIFSMGATAEEAYVRMIDLVTMAEQRLAKATRKIFPGASLPAKTASVAEIAPILRGLISMPAKSGGREAAQRFVFEFRTNPEILAFVNGKEIARYSQQGPVTPDHAIRTKNLPFIAPAPEAGKLDAFRAETKAALDKFAADYHAYFERHNGKQIAGQEGARSRPARGAGAGRRPVRRRQHLEGRQDRGRPRRDHGGGDRRRRAARHLRVHSRARHLRHRILVARAGQAQLGGREAAGAAHRRRDGRRVGHRRGDGGRLARDGAEVVVIDRDVSKVKGFAIACDVTNAAEVRAAFDKVAATYGGVDIVVSNAGAAWQGKIGTVDEATLRQSFELNFWAHQSVAQNAVRIMRAQGLGGCLLFNTSKQAVNPGPTSAPTVCPRPRRCS